MAIARKSPLLPLLNLARRQMENPQLMEETLVVLCGSLFLWMISKATVVFGARTAIVGSCL